MRKTLAALLLPVVLGTGCVDALGIVGGCDAEMREVRQRHGPPDRLERGVRSELWGYGNPPTGFIYEFRWGAAGEPCEVTGPVSQDRLQSIDLTIQAAT